MIVLAAAALAALIFAIVLLIRGVAGLAMPHMQTPDQIRAVLLDDAWATYFDESHTRQEQEAFLSSTLDEAAAQGANTVLLTGQTPGGGVLARKLDSAEPVIPVRSRRHSCPARWTRQPHRAPTRCCSPARPPAAVCWPASWTPPSLPPW